MAKCKLRREIKSGYFCNGFPSKRFYVVRMLNGDWVHHYPTSDGMLPKGYSSKKTADAFVKKWYSPKYHTVKVVSGKQASKYEVPKRW